MTKGNWDRVLNAAAWYGKKKDECDAIKEDIDAELRQEYPHEPDPDFIEEMREDLDACQEKLGDAERGLVAAVDALKD